MIKTLKKLLRSKIVFWLASTILILSLNLTPLVKQIRHAPDGRTFAMIHNNAQDFFFYQALMNEGANGHWLIYDPYTTEPHKPSIIFAYFAWLGKISQTFSVSYALTYHIFRMFGALAFLSAAFYLINMLKMPHPRITYLFFLFASPLMHTINDGGTLRQVPYMHWWTGMDPIRRAGYLPHHMVGGFLLITCLILILRFFSTEKRKYLLYAFPLMLIMAFVHTPSLMILLIILPPSIFFYFLLNIKNLNFIKNYIWLILYWLIGLLALLFMISQTKHGFPWSQYLDWEKNMQFPLVSELPFALGILFPLSLVGAITALLSQKFEKILIASWLIIPIILIPVAPKLGISNIRLIQGAPYLSLAILSVTGITTLIQIVKIGISQLSKYKILNIKYQKFIGLLGYWVIGLFFIYFTYPTISWSLKDQIREYWPIFGNIYLDNRLNHAFKFIDLNYSAKTHTLATFYTGNYLPVFTHTVSFIGHFGYTYNRENKELSAEKFFTNEMSSTEAKDLITSNKIGLIFQGPEEKPIYSGYLYPDILKPVYDREEVTIYVLK